jgi:phosphohistidine swiveling domain-containing protein
MRTLRSKWPGWSAPTETLGLSRQGRQSSSRNRGALATMDSWITDTRPRTRFHLYTRANADEVGPEPFSPLGWSLGWVTGTGPGAADGFVSFGITRPEELAPDHQIFGNWGGYFYNNLSLSRLMGVRMPGVDVDAIDRAYFGDHPEVPPYEADERDEDPDATAKLAVTLERVLSAEGWPAMEAGIARCVEVSESRPDLGALADSSLVDRAREMAGEIRRVWAAYCEVVLAASIGPGVVTLICEEIGRSADSLKLFTGIGGVESAGGALAVWELSRLVRRSWELSAAFDAGVDGLQGRLGQLASTEADSFRAGLERLLYDHGHRGPHEWDLRSHAWATQPELVLGIIDRVRRQDDGHDPVAAASASRAERERLSAELAEVLSADPEAQSRFLAGLRSGVRFYQLREAGKHAVIRLYFEAKLALLELGRRMVDRKILDQAQAVFMLLDAELEPFLADPAAFRDVIAQRERNFALLAGLEPPYIIDSRSGPPPISQWPAKGGTRLSKARAGEVLNGAPGSPGRAVGRARIVVDPATAEIDSGDVLVCRTSDPSWVPLFLAASAVVCDIGAVGSHAAIVARELGVPCAVSVVGATGRIPEGATISVDGSSGAVVVLDVPLP